MTPSSAMKSPSAMKATPPVKAAAQARPAASGKVSRFTSMIEAAEGAGTHAECRVAVGARAGA